jgi:hypothetical protein
MTPPAPTQNTTLLVLGYSFQLVGFTIAVVQLFVTRREISAALDRLNAARRRLVGVSDQAEVLLTAVQRTRATLKLKVIPAPADPNIESRVSRLERQIEEVDLLILQQTDPAWSAGASHLRTSGQRRAPRRALQALSALNIAPTALERPTKMRARDQRRRVAKTARSEAPALVWVYGVLRPAFPVCRHPAGIVATKSS